MDRLKGGRVTIQQTGLKCCISCGYFLSLILMMEMFRLVQKALDGGCKTVVFVGQLCCDAEMMGSECLEIGGVADEYSLVGGKMGLELCRRVRGNVAEHEIGRGGLHADVG